MTTTGTNTPVVQQEQKPVTVKALFSQESVRKKFEDMLGKKAQGFITSVLQAVAQNDKLQKADPSTVYNAAATAAVMDLPINSNLGFAYIVPYANAGANRWDAQFQMGWKGFVQLAQRTGQYKTINTTEIYQNQFDGEDYITGEVKIKNVPPAPGAPVVGFLAYFRLMNGFEKHFYWSIDKMRKHASKYSQSYKNKKGVWFDGEDGFNEMGKKTAIKLLISKFGPLSIEMHKAVSADQAVIEGDDQYRYVDNETLEVNHEEQRITALIGDAKALDKLLEHREHCNTEELLKAFNEKKAVLVKEHIDKAANVKELKKVLDHCDSQELLGLYQEKKLNLESK